MSLLFPLAHYSDSIAIIDSQRSITYGQFLQEIEDQKKALLRTGIVSGEHVALIGDYSVDVFVFLFALIETKSVIMPIIYTSEKDVDAKLNIGNAQWVISIDQGQVVIQKRDVLVEKHPLFQIVKNHPAMILFSSGSTGTPKAILYNLTDFISQFKIYAKRLSSVMVLAFDHIGGIDTFFRLFYMGGLIVCPDKSKDPHYICQLIETYQVNFISASPTFLNLLLLSDAVHHHNLSSLNRINFGAEPMPPFLLARLQAQLPHILFHQTFGTSETGTVSVVSGDSNSLFMKLKGKDEKYKNLRICGFNGKSYDE